ncbi:ADP-heptose--LPS heptosyltransferase I [Veronia nyctiphanis]|uniref:ADP-heptose--LPS heptosyltransferase I n=1 Tax=Veronia nyctiphanis TaxID=1278244 RepID=A0A4Q0YS88_9GAMM|nr:glycosyltransferase family 9 protein [Veronia nyctiphanis]RXJ73523.1 ADP-heptose--LPS heptosyltransferase I [Veronia nyctiphanis]
MALFSSAPDSLCILRLSAIGDVCNAIAAVQSIQRQWPETKLTWIAGKAEASLIAPLMPDVEVITYDKRAGWQGVKTVWNILKGRRFDALLHMQTALRASVLSIGIKARYRLGFDKTRVSDLQQWFTNVKVPSPESLHVLDGFMAFAETLGVKPETPRWSITLPDQDTAWASEMIGDTPTLIIAPAASKTFKNWTAEGYAAVIEHAASLGFRILLAGGPGKSELELGEKIQRLLSVKVDNLIGKTTLLQMVALEQQAKLVLAPDSGPAHLANAIGTPVIGLYAHHNPARTGPYRWRDYVVSVYEDAILAETGKTPADIAWRTRVKDENAMQRITPENVINTFDRLLKDKELQP